MKNQTGKNQNTWTGGWKAFVSLILIACYMKLPSSWAPARINGRFPRISGILCYLLNTYKMVDHGIQGSGSSGSTLSSSPNFSRGCDHPHWSSCLSSLQAFARTLISLGENFPCWSICLKRSCSFSSLLQTLYLLPSNVFFFLAAKG